LVAGVRAIRPDEWRLLKDIRLQALDESPTAFLSIDGADWTDDQWEAEARAATWFLAFTDGRPIGVAGERAGPQPHVVSMWVDPRFRQSGVARQLLEALRSALVARGETRAVLWVLSENTVARLAYERMGLVPTGEWQPLPDGSGRTEERYSLSLTDPAAGDRAESADGAWA
jgi:ribosomal protein S18 acetylase RimI-like enzyme